MAFLIGLAFMQASPSKVKHAIERVGCSSMQMNVVVTARSLKVRAWRRRMALRCRGVGRPGDCTAQVFDRAVAAVLPNHMQLVAMDGDVGMAVGARQIVEFGGDGKGRTDQPIGHVVTRRNGEVDLPTA